MQLSTTATCSFQDNKTALHLAFQYDELQVAQLLVEHGADVNCIDNVICL